MSAENSPHRYKPFDGTMNYYDPDFTVEISNKMRVPDKISVHGDDHRVQNGHNGHHATGKEGNGDWMQVPDRILVAGGDKYMSGRTAMPEMKLESSLLGDTMHDEQVQLMTPPRHLTLNEYPSVEPEKELNEAELRSALKRSEPKEMYTPMTESNINFGSPSNDNFGNSFFNNTSVVGETEMQNLKRQVRTLTRKVSAIERDNSSRYQRDVILYTFGVIYLITKGFTWLNRRW